MSDRTRRKLRVVYAASEVAPFCMTGGLGDVAGTYPVQLAKAGCKVVVMLPKYGTIPQEYVDQMEYVTHFYVSLGWRNEYCGLERLTRNGVDYYFIDNEGYFKRDGLYGYFDDGERFAFFSKAVTESLQYLPNFECDILHCNDWQTALAPIFLREFYQGIPLYDAIRTVFTVHNVKFQGQFGDSVLGDVCGLADIPNAARALYIKPKTINFMKGALLYSDFLTTVSPTYAEELKTPFYGEGMDPIFRERAGGLMGILNGIDQTANDPRTNPALTAHFSTQDLSGKAKCKAALQEELGLEVNPERPLLAMVTRLTAQKGMDLVMYGMEYLLSRSIQVVVLGTGEKEYEDGLRYFAWKYPGSMSAVIAFDPALSKRIYSSADMFLMPSIFEPCGIAQMIAMSYGTLPIVRETGGLKDTVRPYNLFTGEGNGFSFANINADEMVNCVLSAAEIFWTDKETWKSLMIQAMESDFSWQKPVEDYYNLYHRLRPDIIPFYKTIKIEENDKAEEKTAAAKEKEAEEKAVSAAEKKAEAKTAPTSKAAAAVKEASEKPKADAPAPVAKPASKVRPKHPAAKKPALRNKAH